MKLHPFGIKVSIIEPVAVKTPSGKKEDRKDELTRTMPPEAFAHYSDVIKAVAQRAGAEEHAEPSAGKLAKVIEEALIAKKPKARYVVGTPARMQTCLALLPEKRARPVDP